MVFQVKLQIWVCLNIWDYWTTLISLPHINVLRFMLFCIKRNTMTLNDIFTHLINLNMVRTFSTNILFLYLCLSLYFCFCSSDRKFNYRIFLRYLLLISDQYSTEFGVAWDSSAPLESSAFRFRLSILTPRYK